MKQAPTSLSELASRLHALEARMAGVEQQLVQLGDTLKRMTEQTPDEKAEEKAFYDSVNEGGFDN